MALDLQWVPQKAAKNLAKHGVSFQEAESVFRDPLGCITTDPRHSVEEERYVLLGVSDAQRLCSP